MIKLIRSITTENEFQTFYFGFVAVGFLWLPCKCDLP